MLDYNCAQIGCSQNMMKEFTLVLYQMRMECKRQFMWEYFSMAQKVCQITAKSTSKRQCCIVTLEYIVKRGYNNIHVG